MCIIVYRRVNYVEEPMKYQALRPQFFSVGGWLESSWGAWWWGRWSSLGGGWVVLRLVDEGDMGWVIVVWVDGRVGDVVGWMMVCFMGGRVGGVPGEL